MEDEAEARLRRMVDGTLSMEFSSSTRGSTRNSAKSRKRARTMPASPRAPLADFAQPDAKSAPGSSHAVVLEIRGDDDGVEVGRALPHQGQHLELDRDFDPDDDAYATAAGTTLRHEAVSSEPGSEPTSSTSGSSAVRSLRHDVFGLGFDDTDAETDEDERSRVGTDDGAGSESYDELGALPTPRQTQPGIFADDMAAAHPLTRRAHEAHGQKSGPPTASGKALELLVRSKSLMGYVQETLVRDDNVFMVPGHAGLSVSTSFVADSQDSGEASNGEKTASGAAPSVGTGGWGAPPDLPRCMPTIHFRAALMAMSMLIVALACILIASVSLTLATNVTDEIQSECTRNVADLMETSRIALEEFARQDSISALDVLSAHIQRKYLDQAVGLTGQVAGSLDAIRHYDPAFTGQIGPLDQAAASPQVLSAAYNISVGSVLAVPLATELSRSVRSVFVGFEDTSEVVIAVEDRFLDYGCVELCTPSPNCTSYPMSTDGLRRPMFDLPNQAHPSCVNDNFDYDKHPLRLKELQLMADNDDSPVLFWWALLDFQGDPSMLMTFIRPYGLCLDENRTCFNALIGAQLDLQGLSCFLHEQLNFNFSSADVDASAARTAFGVSSKLASASAPDSSTSATANGLSYLVFNGVNSTGADIDDGDRVGMLVASSDACRPAQVDPELLEATPVVDYENGTGAVARSAIFVRNNWLGGHFGSPGSRQAALVNLDTQTLCESGGNGGTGSRKDCFFVSMIPIQGPVSDPYESIDMGNQVELLAIAVVPHDLYLQKLEYLKAEYSGIVASLDEKQSERWTQAFALVTGVTLAIVIIVCVASACLSWRFGGSIIQLSSFMRDLETLKFSRVKTSELSRVDEIAQMQTSFNDMCSTIEVMAKFVPSAVVKAVITNSGGKGRRLHVRRRNVTILFSDIAGFTSISERLGERDLLLFLVRYLTVMTAVVEAYGGVVGEILGDGILAFWNTPDPVEDHEAKACASALAQQESMRFLNEYFADMLGAVGCGELSIRIGIHTGDVLTGNIGSVTRYKWGALGDAVNLASRLEGINKLYGTGIIISQSTFDALPSRAFVTRKLDRVAVKGKAKTVTVYELVSMRRKLLGRSTSDARVVTESRAASASASEKILGSQSDKLRQAKFMSARLPLVSAAKFRGSFRLSRFPRSGSQSDGACSGVDDDAHVLYEYGPVSELRSELLGDIAAYERALAAFQSGRFADADEELQQASARSGAGRANQLLQARIDTALLEHGAAIEPSEHTWDGTLRLQAKEF